MSQRIPESFIQEVLSRNDIVEIIRSRVSLTQRGDNHLARCPFHEEKTPSFNVSHSKQFYYCFGCSASGNAIGFLIAFDHMEFREAVTYLASQAGLEMPAFQTDDDNQRYQSLYQVLEDAARYYRTALRNHPPAIEYLKSRGVSGLTAKHFGLGYAPDGGRQSLQELANPNIPDWKTALATSGLTIIKDSDRPYERFRNRIMFPIRNIQGQIIGFGGRSLGNAQPKYLNSPETPLFHKGNELYGLHEARQHSPKLSQLVVVEGYMDVIALHQHGITHAVATLGTAVTAKQVQKCLRYVNHVTFCFDGDRAGRQAAWKALTIALPLLRDGIHISFLFLPEAEDPDSLVRKIGADAFLQRLAQAVPLPEVFFKELKAQAPLDSPADKAHYGQQAAQYLNAMPHGLFRQLMYDQLAKELQIESQALTTLLQPQPSSPAPAQPSGHTKLSTHDKRAIPHRAKEGQFILEEQLISHLLKDTALATQFHIQEFEQLMLDTDQLRDTFLELDAVESNLPKPTPLKYGRLFVHIAKILHQYPTATIGELLLLVEGEPERQLVATLAARPLLLPLENIKNEFLGGLSSVKQQNTEMEMQLLVKKAKKSQLNLEEKRKLQTLLATLKKDASER